MMESSGFDWEHSGPSEDALVAFSRVSDEAEFPNTYSGAGWRAAYRIWKIVQEDRSLLLIGPYEDVKGVDTKDLGLSGFQYGWAVNAVRQMLGIPPGPNPAIVTLGVPVQPDYPSIGSPEDAMKEAIGPGEDERGK